MSESEDLESYEFDRGYEDGCDAARESIAAYLEHISTVEIGRLCLNGLFTADQMPKVCANWVRNRLDEKWAAEVAANQLPSVTP